MRKNRQSQNQLLNHEWPRAYKHELPLYNKQKEQTIGRITIIDSGATEHLTTHAHGLVMFNLNTKQCECNQCGKKVGMTDKNSIAHHARRTHMKPTEVLYQITPINKKEIELPDQNINTTTRK